MLGTLKSVLLGSKLRVLFTLFLTVGVVAAGGFSLGFLGTPSVEDVQNRFGDVTDETTEVRTDLVVHNPNPVGASVGDVSVTYDVLMNDVTMAEGTKEGIAVESGNSTISLTTWMDNGKIPAWWASHVRNGEHTDVRVDATARSETLDRSVDAPPVEREIETDLISAFDSDETRPVNADRLLVDDPVAYVNETGANWGEVTDAETPIDMEFVVYNPKLRPLAITEIGYNITMNDVNVGSGATDEEHLIEGRTSEIIAAETVIQNDRLDEWWVTHLENDQVTDLRIEFYAKVEFAGETYRVALDEMTYEQTVETDIFGNKGETNATASDGEETTASTDEETTTDDTTTEAETTEETNDEQSETTTEESETTTDEETATEGETTSDDETTTEDDGLLGLSAAGVR